MGLLTREEMLGRPLRSEVVTVPDFGDVMILELSAAQRDSWDASFELGDNGKCKPECLRNMRARLCVLSIVDEKRMPVFSPADVESVGGMSSAFIDPVYQACRRLNGFDLEEVGKNSEATPGSDSITD